jgi:hypothetical protein
VGSLNVDVFFPTICFIKNAWKDDDSIALFMRKTGLGRNHFFISVFFPQTFFQRRAKIFQGEARTYSLPYKQQELRNWEIRLIYWSQMHALQLFQMFAVQLYQGTMAMIIILYDNVNKYKICQKSQILFSPKSPKTYNFWPALAGQWREGARAPLSSPSDAHEWL